MEAIIAIGLTLNVVRLVELTAQAGNYINTARNASKSRTRLAQEEASLLLLLTDLRHRLESIDTSNDLWFRGIQSLVVQDGPLDLFSAELQALGERLDPQTGWKKARSLMLWPLKEKDINELLSRIERLKGLVTVALQQDGFSLMLALRNQNTELAKSVTSMARGLDELQHDSIEYALARERRKVIAWLSPLDFASQQKDVFSKRQAHTGRWFFKTNQFQDWMHGKEAVLWCNGIPGSGKTVLTSVIIAYLQNQFASKPEVGIGYIYLNHQQHSNHTPTAIIGSLLQQLVRSGGHVVSNELIEYYESHSDAGRRPRLSEIFQILQAETRRLDVYFVVIDAFDESEETSRSILLAHLMRLRPKIRVMLTSREKPIPIYDLQSTLLLEISACDTDLRLYLKARLKELPMARHITGDQMLEAHITKTIANKAKGMFLLAKLQVDSLAKMSSKRDVRNSVELLPETLTQTYNEAIARIRLQDPARVQLASKVLMWLSSSWRPLTIMELRSAMAMTPGVQYLDSEALPYEDDVVAVCMGLVDIERGSGIIALVHETTQKYFERFRHALFPDADEEISRTCIEYMMLVDRTTALRVSSQGYENEMAEYPLLKYAVQFWAQHALKVTSLELEPLIFHFIQQETSLFLLLTYMTNAIEISESSSPINATSFDRNYYPFMIACSYGLQETVRSMVTTGINPSGSHEAFIRPLQLAVCGGHIGTARFLISSGVDVDAGGLGVDRPIALAVKKGLLSIVELLIDGRARLDARGEGPWCSILELAILYQHESIVQLLLKRGADVETRDYLERTALSCAASTGNTAIVQLLLDYGADINAKNPREMTVLHIAADSGVRTVAEILLDHGAKQADTSILLAKDEDGRMPLHYSTSSDVVNLFVTRGAEINARDSQEATPLLEAARSGLEDVILALVELGADPQAKNNEQETMLSILEDSNNIKLIETLRQKGVDSGDNGSGRTALHWTVAFAEMRLARVVSVEQKKGHESRASLVGSKHKYKAAIVQAIERGSDVNAKDNSGSTSLHLAIRRWIMTPQLHRQSTDLLLKHGADANEQDRNGDTPLHLAAFSGFLKAVTLLIEFGADLHIRNHDGHTALKLATNNTKSPSATKILAAQAFYSASSSYETADDERWRDKERENVIELLRKHGGTM